MNGEIRDAGKMKEGRVQCPYCNRWNSLAEMDSGSVLKWHLEYDGQGRYSLSRFAYCLYCEREMYIDLEITGLGVRDREE